METGAAVPSGLEWTIMMKQQQHLHVLLPGAAAVALLQGIDCPMNAAFMDATIFYGGMPHPKTFKNAICVFERHTGEISLWHRL
jgi:hypothetical protein